LMYFGITRNDVQKRLEQHKREAAEMLFTGLEQLGDDYYYKYDAVCGCVKCSWIRSLENKFEIDLENYNGIFKMRLKRVSIKALYWGLDLQTAREHERNLIMVASRRYSVANYQHAYQTLGQCWDYVEYAFPEVEGG